MPDFFQTYFIDPITYNTGYNIVNTLAYALILIASAFIVYKLLKRLGVRIDRKFLVGISPFIAFGGILRAYEDLLEATGAVGVLKGFIITDAFGAQRNVLLLSPLIYVLIFVVALAALIIARLVQNYRKIDYWKTWAVIGIILNIAVLSQLRFVSAFALASVFLITAGWAAAIIVAGKIAEKKNIGKLKALLTPENSFLIGVHMFEATTTFVALQFPKQLGVSYFEQHVVAGFVTGVLGPASFFLLKIIVVPIVLYYLDKEFKPQEYEKKNFLKIIVLILGLGPGLRNFLRMVMGV